MRSGSRRSRYAIGSNPKLMLLAYTLCRSSSRSQSSRINHRRDPVGLGAVAGGRLHQRRDVFDHRARSHDRRRARQVCRGRVDRRPGARRSREVADFDIGGTDAGQVLGPEGRLHAIDKTRQLVQASRIDRRGRCRTKRHAMHQQRHLVSEGLERTRCTRRGRELLLGDHLDDVDAIEVGEDAGRERGLPRDPEAVRSVRLQADRLTSFHNHHTLPTAAATAPSATATAAARGAATRTDAAAAGRLGALGALRAKGAGKWERECRYGAEPEHGHQQGQLAGRAVGTQLVARSRSASKSDVRSPSRRSPRTVRLPRVRTIVSRDEDDRGDHEERHRTVARQTYRKLDGSHDHQHDDGEARRRARGAPARPGRRAASSA